MENSSFSLRGFTNCVEIDRGGSAVIYRADQPEFGRQVAIKVLSSFRDPAALERFNTERKTMGQLSHAQGIVSVYTSGTIDLGDPYLVLPFYENGSLQDELDYHGPLRWRKAAQHIIEVCRSVDFAHSKGVHHRDIKPANLLVADDGNVHIADFGIASLALADPGEQMLCTPAFAPPEVLWGDTTANAVSIDVYGLGASLWALLDGRAPFSAIYASGQGEFEHYTMRSWATTHQLEDFAELVNTEQVADLRDTVPDPICATVEQAMSKIPEERFSSARALGNALRYSIRLSAEELVQRQPASLASYGGQTMLVADRTSSSAIILDEPDINMMEPTEQIPATPYHPEPATTVFQEAADATSDNGRGTPPPPPPGSELPEDAKQNRVGASLLILAVIVTVVVVVGLGFLLATNADGTPSGGTIGDYVGGPIEEAQEDAGLAGWVIKQVPIRKDDTIPGEVVEQDIAAGTELEDERTLKLHVSGGPEIRQVPDLEGLTEEEARTEIEEANLKVGTVTEEIDDEIPFDQVSKVLVDGSPPEEGYETGTKIDLFISSGPAEITVRRVETAEEAQQILGEEQRLVVEITEEFSDQVETGQVIRTEPAIGTKAKPGDTITVYLSSGPKVREIPDVIGLTADEAADALGAEGFNVKREDRGPDNCRFKIRGNEKTECDNYDNNKVWDYGPEGTADIGTEIRILVKE